MKIRASPQRRERFYQQCADLEISKLELIPDIRTRWNSTEFMIERALKLKEPLSNLTSYDKDLNDYIFSEEEWECIKNIHKLMKVCNLYIIIK